MSRIQDVSSTLYRYRDDRLSVDQRFEFTIPVRISEVLNMRSVIRKDSYEIRKIGFFLSLKLKLRLGKHPLHFSVPRPQKSAKQQARIHQWLQTIWLPMPLPGNTTAPCAKSGCKAINRAPILFDLENPITCSLEEMPL